MKESNKEISADEIFKDVWSTLSSVNVSEFTEDRGGLTYLSWASAWTELMKYYPGATFDFIGNGENSDCQFYPDGSASVTCVLTILGVSRKMWLPVMDYRHNAVKNPSSRQISDCKMRCLTKCMALFGLGMHVFRNEDLPETPSNKGSSESKVDKPKKPKGKKPEKISSPVSEHPILIASRELLVEASKNGTDLIEVWKKNAETMKKLKEDDPETYSEIVSLFKEKRDQLAKGE